MELTLFGFVLAMLLVELINFSLSLRRNLFAFVEVLKL